MKDIVTQLRTNSECLAPSIMLAAADEIERLRAERDEARREICRMVFANGGIRPAEYARTVGWDCFKENTDG
jgi:hypothetical protein